MLVANGIARGCTKKSNAMIGLERNYFGKPVRSLPFRCYLPTRPFQDIFPLNCSKKYAVLVIKFFYFSHQTYFTKYLSYMQFSSFDLQLLYGLLLI